MSLELTFATRDCCTARLRVCRGAVLSGLLVSTIAIVSGLGLLELRPIELLLAPAGVASTVATHLLPNFAYAVSLAGLLAYSSSGRSR
jgi:hypothetical protein